MSVQLNKLTEQYAASKQFIEAHDEFLVVSHVQPDGDAASSTCAIGLVLQYLNKNYVMINEEEMPSKFNYLPGASAIVDYSNSNFKQTFKHVITVDCADFSRLGRVKELFAPDVQILNIDHHATNNSFGQINLIDDVAAATAEVLFDLISYMDIPWTLDLANCIYTGLLTDTGGFRYANTTTKVMRIASELINHGVDANQLAGDLLEKLSVPHIHLLKRALNRLAFSQDNQISWLSVTVDDMKKTAASNGDLEGIVNYPRNIEQVEVGLFFRELEDNKVKVSFRSSGKVDVAKFAQTFGGGGHMLASGATIEGTLEEVIQRIVSALEVQLR